MINAGEGCVYLPSSQEMNKFELQKVIHKKLFPYLTIYRKISKLKNFLLK